MTDATSTSAGKTASWHGLLVVDKPAGITSRAALDRVAASLPRKTRIGHAGTLDPLASGVLVLCIGTATRLVEFVQDLSKSYQARIRLGANSNTDDADGICEPVPDAQPPSLADLRHELDCFVGKIQQTPPRFSAAHHEGQRAYQLARKNREFDLAPRTVRISKIAIDAYEYPYLDLTIDCGKGTYIRSLARDLGDKLGCGGLIATLRRTRIGGFDTNNAVTMETATGELRKHLLPLGQAVVHLPRLDLSDILVARLRLGQRLARQDIANFPAEGSDHLAVFDSAGNLAVIVRFDRDLDRISPAKVIVASGTDHDC
jgi:tRNA pseudouridine55 synthase